MLKYAIITGGAGFIGSHLVGKLLGEGNWKVTVLDNFDPFYPRSIKENNLAQYRQNPSFRLVEGDILEDAALAAAFANAPSAETVVVHLAALTGVRPSVARPMDYHRVNVTGTLKVLEMAQRHGTAHFVLASSSSVYGVNPHVPWKESLAPLHPISPYAATKLAAETFARVHARLHGLDTTVLRFFTVYGPRQRPDLAIHSFFRKITEGTPIQQFGDGSTRRDYTYVEDIVGGIRAAMDRPLQRVPGQGAFDVFNLGHSEPIALRDLISAIEREAGHKAVIEQLPEQPGDVPMTCADVTKAAEQFGYAAKTGLAEGLHQFAKWYTHAKLKEPA